MAVQKEAKDPAAAALLAIEEALDLVNVDGAAHPAPQPDARRREARQAITQAEGVSLSTLIDHLGVEAAKEFFNRIDHSQRRGQVIVGNTVRDSRSGFTRAYQTGQAQFVTPGKTSVNRAPSAAFSDSVVIIKMDDLAAVVRAARKAFDWKQEFAPRAGLAAALTTPTLKRASRGRRRLQA